MLGKILGFGLLFAVIGAVVIFIEPIKNFSQNYNLQDASIPELESALQKNHGNVEIALHLAEEYRKQGSPKYRRFSEKIYQDILKQDANNIDAMKGYARVLADQPGRDNEALVQYRNALKINQSDEGLLEELGNFYKVHAEDASVIDPALRRWLYEWSVYYYRLALYVKPGRFQPRFNLGVAYQQLDQRADAAREYCNAIVLYPESYESRYNLGLVLLDLNQLNEAGRQFNKAVSILADSEGGQLDAQQLARRIEAVKSSVYYDEAKSGLTPEATPDYLSPGCLLNTI